MEVKLQERYKLFINGEWRDASDGQTVKTYSPVDGSLLAEVAEATKEDVDAAVSSAREAFRHGRTQLLKKELKSLTRLQTSSMQMLSYLQLLKQWITASQSERQWQLTFL